MASSVCGVEDRILSCNIKDQTGLNDFQKLPDASGIPINKVGISQFRIPMNYLHRDGSTMNHDTIASMYVNLEGNKTGINMSRLCAILQQEAQKNDVGVVFMKNMLGRYRADLRDAPDEPLLGEAYLKLRFNYPMKQPSLKSDNWGWQYYPCSLEAKAIGDKIRLFLTVQYWYSSTCPCSLSMAKQYEQDYRDGKTTEGNGIAAAHAQRSEARCTIEFDSSSIYYIEDLVELLRRALPTEVQSLVKRLDEQAFAILNGANPMFVEHSTRRLFVELNKDARILDWVVSVEHWESLHAHNAVGVICKGIPGGLR